jgi:hypothetical protein
MSSFDIPSPRCDFVDSEGKISREWNMFLRTVFSRIGGTSGESVKALTDLVNQLLLENGYRQIVEAFPPIPQALQDIQEYESLIAHVAELSKKTEDLKQEIAMLPDPSALLAETRKFQGVTNGSTGSLGSIGELLSATGSAVSLTNGIAANICSIPLTAGDFYVWGGVQFNPAATTVQTALQTSINTTSAAIAASPFYALLQATFGAGLSQTLQPPARPIVITGPGTVYLVAAAQFSVSTETASGFLFAERFH